MDNALTTEALINNSLLLASALIWTIVGIFLFKMFAYNSTTDGKFLPWFWRYRIDLFRGILVTLVFVKLGDFGIDFVLKSFNLDVSGLEDKLEDNSLSPVQLSIVLAYFVQRWIYTRRIKRQNSNT